MIKNIRHVGIVVDDLSEAVKFYNKLGFRVYNSGMVTYEESFVLYGSAREIKYKKMYIENCDKDTGEDLIELYEIPGESGYQGYNHIALSVQDIEKAWTFFRKKGLTMSRRIVERDRHRLFFATDPWFNMLEIVQPPV